MGKSKFENGIDYVLVGDYYLHSLSLPAEEENIALGRFGMDHKNWI